MRVLQRKRIKKRFHIYTYSYKALCVCIYIYICICIHVNENLVDAIMTAEKSHNVPSES